MCVLCNSWSTWAPENYLENGRIEVRADKALAKPAKRLVRKTIREIDQITGVEIDFSFSDDVLAADADVVIHGVDEWTGDEAQFNGRARGLAFVDDGVAHATWRNDLIIGEKRLYNKKGQLRKVKPAFVNERSKYTIAHEILHVFGLSHPNDNGYDTGFDTNSTLMSYFFTGQYNGLGPLDEATLIDIWGAA